MAEKEKKEIPELAEFGDLPQEKRDEIKKLIDDALKKFAAPEPSKHDIITGVCVICKGKIVSKQSKQALGDPKFIGRHITYVTVHHGYYCTQCGIKYEFLPMMQVEVH